MKFYRYFASLIPAERAWFALCNRLDENQKPYWSSGCTLPSSHMFGSFMYFRTDLNEFDFAIFHSFPLLVDKP